MSTNEEALKRMTKLVHSLYSRVDCEPFRDPVDWKALELWDYPKIITKMMDLGTVKRKLERGGYATAADCAEDVRLIWKNCKTYNADGSDFYVLAEILSKRFEERYKRIRAELGNDDATKCSLQKGEKGGPPSLDVKTKFASNLLRLTGMELGHVLQVLDLKCPQALEQPDYDNPPSADNGLATDVEINVDAIDTRTFLELDKYVREKVDPKSSNHNNTNSHHHQPFITGNISYEGATNNSNKRIKR